MQKVEATGAGLAQALGNRVAGDDEGGDESAYGLAQTLDRLDAGLAGRQLGVGKIRSGGPVVCPRQASAASPEAAISTWQPQPCRMPRMPSRTNAASSITITHLPQAGSAIAMDPVNISAPAPATRPAPRDDLFDEYHAC